MRGRTAHALLPLPYGPAYTGARDRVHGCTVRESGPAFNGERRTGK